MTALIIVREKLLCIGYDLPAVKARYHISCYQNFQYIESKSSGTSKKEDVSFQRLTQLILQDKNKMWNYQELEKEYHQDGSCESTKYSGQSLVARL